MADPNEPPRSLPQPVGTGMPIDPRKLERLMNERGLSRLALANLVTQVAREQEIRTPHGHLVTYSRDAVSKLLKSERRPKISTLTALCAALNCTAEELLYEDPAYGVSASAVADSLTGNTDPISSLADFIPPQALAKLMELGYRTLADLAKADADGELILIPGLDEPPLDVARSVMARAAGYREGTDEPGT